MKPLIIYHADCTDGFGAAFAAWLKLGKDAEYLPMHYGKDYSKTENTFVFKDREVYILDFSFPREIMSLLLEGAKHVVWLDHHKTAFEMWHRTERTYFKDESGIHDEYILLDNNKSGALLAWEYFHPETKAPMLIKHIDDRDRWQFKLEGSKELHAALASYKPWSFEQWYQMCFLQHALPTRIKEGATLLRAQATNIESMLKQRRLCCIKFVRMLGEDDDGFTWNGLACNSQLHTSELGHELANKSETFGLVWYVAQDNRVKCSLRSNGDYDVSAIAKAFGGGGHKNAAGFETDINTLMGWLE